jgi:hypothetical protein
MKGCQKVCVFVSMCVCVFKRSCWSEIPLNMKPFEELTTYPIHLRIFYLRVLHFFLKQWQFVVNNSLGFKQVNLRVIGHLHLITQWDVIQTLIGQFTRRP